MFDTAELALVTTEVMSEIRTPTPSDGSKRDELLKTASKAVAEITAMDAA